MASMEIGRLMFRVEGDMWNAYWGAGTEVRTVLLGSIRMSMVRHPKAKKKFMRLMQDAFADACEEVIGARPNKWDIRPGPENERGSA